MKQIHDLKLLVVDDEQDLLQMIGDLLKKDGYKYIVTAKTCVEARQQFDFVQPNCIILDINLPDGDGFSLMREIRKTSDVPVLFLSARDHDEDKLLGLGLGADDYITKPFLPRELSLRIAAILNRTYFSTVYSQDIRPVFLLGKTKVDLERGVVAREMGEVDLTAKEYALIEKLYENKNKIVTADTLCEYVWHDRYYGYENTLMVHIRRLREKIEEMPSKPQYLLTARGIGYKLEVF